MLLRKSNMDDKTSRELFALLREFTAAVLRIKPLNLHNFAADYFEAKRGMKAYTGEIDLPSFHSYHLNNRLRTVDQVPDRPQTRCRSVDYFKTEKKVYEKRRDDCPKKVYKKKVEPVVEPIDQWQVKLDAMPPDLLERLRNVIPHISFFEDLSPVQIDHMICSMVEKKVKPDEWVIYQGDIGHTFYVVEYGLFDVMIKFGDAVEPKKVFTFDNKGSFGELALMFNKPRNASIVARSEGVLWEMDRISFHRIVLGKEPDDELKIPT